MSKIAKFGKKKPQGILEMKPYHVKKFTNFSHFSIIILQWTIFNKKTKNIGK